MSQQPLASERSFDVREIEKSEPPPMRSSRHPCKSNMSSVLRSGLMTRPSLRWLSNRLNMTGHMVWNYLSRRRNKAATLYEQGDEISFWK